MSIMEEKLVAELRAFNRFYTRILGLLDEHIVDSPFSLAEARVLYEISTLRHTTAADLSRSLGLDPGYLSRMLRRLVAAEYIIVTPGVTDWRSIRPTGILPPAGRPVSAISSAPPTAARACRCVTVTGLWIRCWRPGTCSGPMSG